MKNYKTTIGNIYNKLAIIERNGIKDMKFSRVGCFALTRNLKKINQELADFEEEKIKLISEYTNGGTEIDDKNPNWNDFLRELNRLASVEISVDLTEISVNDLPEELTPSQLEMIEFMIEE